MFTYVLGPYDVSVVFLVSKPFGGSLTASVNSCAKIKGAPSVV